MNTYKSGLALAKKIFGGEFRYETDFFLSVNNERCKAMMREISRSKDLRIEETILLRSYLHKTFWIKKA